MFVPCRKAQRSSYPYASCPFALVPSRPCALPSLHPPTLVPTCLCTLSPLQPPALGPSHPCTLSPLCPPTLAPFCHLAQTHFAPYEQPGETFTTWYLNIYSGFHSNIVGVNGGNFGFLFQTHQREKRKKVHRYNFTYYSLFKYLSIPNLPRLCWTSTLIDSCIVNDVNRVDLYLILFVETLLATSRKFFRYMIKLFFRETQMYTYWGIIQSGIENFCAKNYKWDSLRESKLLLEVYAVSNAQ